MNVAVVFGGGPKSGERNINMYLVESYPVIYYPISAALSAKGIREVFVSTDDDEIAGVAEGLSCSVIRRSPDLGGMGEAISYTGERIIEMHSSCKNIVILSGNNVMVSPYLIEKSLEVLEKRREAKSVITVWKARHDHPSGALGLKDGKFIRPFLDEAVEKEVYFHDGSVCVIRAEVIRDGCFWDRRWWLKLPDCVPLIRPWTTGRDVHNTVDLSLAGWWLQSSPVDTVEEVG